MPDGIVDYLIKFTACLKLATVFIGSLSQVKLASQPAKQYLHFRLHLRVVTML